MQEQQHTPTEISTPKQQRRQMAEIEAKEVIVVDRNTVDAALAEHQRLLGEMLGRVEEKRTEELRKIVEDANARRHKAKSLEDVLRHSMPKNAEGKFDLDAVRSAAYKQADDAVEAFYKEAEQTAPKTFRLTPGQVAGVAGVAVLTGLAAGIGGTVLVQRRRAAAAEASSSTSSDPSTEP